MIKNFKKINNKIGNIFKILSITKPKKYIKEVYITEINYKKIKGWNYHIKATACLIVISGKVEFKITKNFSLIKKFSLSEKKNECLIIKPKTWFSFKGMSKKNRIINLSNYKHYKNETKKKPIKSNN